MKTIKDLREEIVYSAWACYTDASNANIDEKANNGFSELEVAEIDFNPLRKKIDQVLKMERERWQADSAAYRLGKKLKELSKAKELKDDRGDDSGKYEQEEGN